MGGANCQDLMLIIDDSSGLLVRNHLRMHPFFTFSLDSKAIKVSVASAKNVLSKIEILSTEIVFWSKNHDRKN